MPASALSPNSRWRIIGGGVIILALIAVTAVAQLSGPGRPAAAKQASAAPAAGPGTAPVGTAASGTAADPGLPGPTITGPAPPPISPALTLGRAGAPVTIIEFGDYQCTSCAAFASDTQAALIRQTGQDSAACLRPARKSGSALRRAGCPRSWRSGCGAGAGPASRLTGTAAGPRRDLLRH